MKKKLIIAATIFAASQLSAMEKNLNNKEYCRQSPSTMITELIDMHKQFYVQTKISLDSLANYYPIEQDTNKLLESEQTRDNIKTKAHENYSLLLKKLLALEQEILRADNKKNNPPRENPPFFVNGRLLDSDEEDLDNAL